MAKRSSFTDAEFGQYLQELFDRTHEALDGDYSHEDHPIRDVKSWNKIANGTADDSDEPAATYPTEGGAKDAALRRSWSKASAPVRMALDACGLDVGRSASDSLAVAEANLRHQGYSSNDGLFTELRSYHSVATKPRGAAAATRRMIPGLDRLR
jgi:hypothetical protein